jgi:hypothetical protein
VVVTFQAPPESGFQRDKAGTIHQFVGQKKQISGMDGITIAVRQFHVACNQVGDRTVSHSPQYSGTGCGMVRFPLGQVVEQGGSLYQLQVQSVPSRVQPPGQEE